MRRTCVCVCVRMHLCEVQVSETFNFYHPRQKIIWFYGFLRMKERERGCGGVRVTVIWSPSADHMTKSEQLA